MRILAIRGQNIASLADKFEIDFTAEPLKSAGLFAITGETGAGKSSILDALCLALYGDCPRFGLTGGNEDVPDAGGEAIKARDARGVLRRGASQGYATVDFVGLDGEAYQATWIARRARGRVNGRLQNIERSVQRLSDGKVLDSQTRAVEARVPALTGLTYDEFRRTVLLAQGDFDAFLRADARDRGALLEKVTGTEIYRDISIRVFDRYSKAKADHDLLVARRAEHQLLSEEERAALDDEEKTLLAAIELARTGRQILEADVARHRALAEAQRRHGEAVQVAADADAALMEAAGDRADLERIDQVEPLRLPWARARTATANVTKAEGDVSRARITLEHVAQQAVACRQEQDIAQATVDEAERVFKEFGPIWSKAADLDSRIVRADQEAIQAATAAAASVDEHSKALAQLRELDAERARELAKRQAVQGVLEARPQTALLVRNWRQITQAFDERHAARRTAHKAREQAGVADAEVQKLRAALGESERQDATDQAARADLSSDFIVHQARLAKLAPEVAARRVEALSDLQTVVGDLKRAAEDYAGFQAQVQKAQAALAGAELDRDAAAKQVQEAERRIADAEIEVKALTAPTDRARDAVSDSARDLRKRLVPGQPCPVCGAKEHPIHADAVLAELARGLQVELDAARGRAEKGRHLLTMAQGKVAQAEAVAKQLRISIQEAEARAEAAEHLYVETRPKAERSDLPAGPDGAVTAILEVGRQLAEERRTLQGQLGQAEELRQAITRLTIERDRLTDALEQRQGTRQCLADEANAKGQSYALYMQTAAAAEERIGTIDAGLASALEAGDLTQADLEVDADEVRRVLAELVTERETAEAEVLAVDAALAGLAPRISGIQARADELLIGADKLKAAADARAAELNQLRGERAGLLDGEATDVHRTRINDARTVAIAVRDEGQQKLQAAESAVATAKQALSGAATALAECQAEQLEANGILDEALVSVGLTAEELSEILSRPRSEVDALRSRLTALADRRTSAHAALRERQGDLATAEAVGVPEVPLEDLQQQISGIDSEQSARQERVGAIRGRMQTDAQARKNLAGLEAEIAEARATFDVWQAVNSAVGSKNGDRFVQHAQSITLDLLVDRANHHLADLKPRYRLVRAAGQDLAMHVVDRDMGDEVRSVRSLSGGERFLVSLALALAFSRMGGHGGLAATLFIDEGFGSLDAESLDLAIDALEALQSQGRTVGVISHVEMMKDRIPVQVNVTRAGGGKSRVSIKGTSWAESA
ncbi:SMC domain protein [Nitrospirillum viridazoti Y2]|uniref:Exonuclease SbcC n=1 Tax=Nitrospirillum amazonense TaxID=28077 RepID=A0A560ICS8_9PROT|nr:AAA family ATPase [Nitrospirillum amazonense]EGY02526.1 SMC domain protein [Nitrospirillum amazonense Y2]TWB56125.1 exonuclease SbcC [Nitrospirillum amazonense]